MGHSSRISRTQRDPLSVRVLDVPASIEQLKVYNRLTR